MRQVFLDLCSKEGRSIKRKANPKRTIMCMILLKEALTNKSFL
jgi:hypothetical protein